MKLVDVVTALASADAQLAKAQGEIAAKINNLNASIADLQSQIAGETVSPELEAAVNKVVFDAQALDDIVPDVPVV